MSAVTWQGETHVRFGSATALTAKCFSGFSEERPDLLDVTNSKHCCLLPFDLAVLKQWFCCNACRFWTLTCPFSITWQLLAKTVGRSMRPVGFSLKLLQGADHLPTIVEPVEPLSRLTSQTPADALRPCCSFRSQRKSAIFFRLVGDQLNSCSWHALANSRTKRDCCCLL